MQTFKYSPGAILISIGLCLLLVATPACKKKEREVFYTVNSEEVLPPSAAKGKEKTEEQYISILYANLFQKALSVSILREITNLILSIGDRHVAHEVVIGNFMNRPDVLIPTRAEMMADLEGFIDEMYTRFFVRKPTIAEKTYFVNYITTHTTVTPEILYTSFALSNEYLFY